MERVVLITGAGTGIGLASVLEAARLGFSAVAAVHHESEADGVRKAVADAHLPAGAVEVEALDVRDEARARAVITAREPWGLVNNAAVINAGLLVDVPVQDAREQFDVIAFAPLRLAQLAIPAMGRGCGGRIVNVSSIGGDTTTPALGWYQAAESALSTLSSVLRQEVAHLGIEVVVVEPGLVDSDLWGHAADDLRRRRDDALDAAPYDQAVGAMAEARARGVGTDEVARTVGTALHAGHPRFRYRVGTGAHTLPFIERVVPTGLRDRVTRAAGVL